jgi:hypothetical protein
VAGLFVILCTACHLEGVSITGASLCHPVHSLPP